MRVSGSDTPFSSPRPERRKGMRRRTMFSGTIRSQSRTNTMTCQVRNLSGAGARLELPNTAWLQERFELDIPLHDLRVPAKIIWRTLDAVGVEFIRQDGVGTSIIQANKVVSLEAERERMKNRIQQLTNEV